MNKSLLTALVIGCALAAGCGKKKPAETTEATAPAATSTPAPAPAPVTAQPPAPAAEPSDAERERALKQSKLDYATMEDKYLNDARGQWATAAKASSTFGDDGGKTPSDTNLAANAIGPVNDKSWTNNHQDIGFDWLELGYDKRVTATEVRVVLPNGEGVEAISKLELLDTDGKTITIWSGLSDVKQDNRGQRTWFIRSFDKTATKINGVKVTFANNVQRGYKVVDAVQLVGD